MYTISCKTMEPSLGLDHRIKGMNMDDLKRNIKFHIRETHPEINFSDEDMFRMYHRAEEIAEMEEFIVEET